MKNKKCKIFLLIGFAVFIFSIIAILICEIMSYNEIKTKYANDLRMQADLLAWDAFLILFFFTPILAEELSWIRSTYKLLKHRPKGLVKICYIIAASLSFSAFIFHGLLFIGIINFNDEVNGNASVLLSTQWPVIILSFLLASVRPKGKSQELDITQAE